MSSCDEAIQPSFSAPGLLRVTRNDGAGAFAGIVSYVIARSSCDEAIQSSFSAPGLLRVTRNDGAGAFARIVSHVIARNTCDEATQPSFSAPGLLRVARNDGTVHSPESLVPLLRGALATKQSSLPSWLLD